MSKDEVSCLSVLSRVGVNVRAIKGNSSLDVVQHVGAVHAKYIVVDSAVTLVMSENLVEQGLPTDCMSGNRGWGLLVRNGGLASFVEAMFDEDSRADRGDSIAWISDPRFNRSAVLPKLPESNHTRNILSSFTLKSSASVTVFPSPDSS